MEQKLPPFATGVQLCLKELLHYKSHTVHWQPPGKSIWSQLNGSHQSNQKGRGMNFSEVRQYQAGDDIRSIDWRVTARTGKAHTKLFTEEREQPVILYLDLSRNMRFGSQLLFKSVQCAHLASLLSWLTVEQKDRIGAVIDMGDRLVELKPTARQQGALHISHQLMQLNNEAIQQVQDQQQNSSNTVTELPFNHALQTLHRMCPKGSDIIFISDFQRLTEESKPLLNQLRQHNRLQFVHIFDPLEMGNTHFRGSEYVTNGQHTHWLNFGLKNTRKQLENSYVKHLNQLDKICKNMAIPMRSLSCAEPLLTQLGAQSSHSSASISPSGDS
ncbi:cytosolic protein [Vibrio rumoiensis 1S-45]|uniref:Cytosolic protein n=2 Tax=Vibrio rumoiensis TaxID=76258 RepID=A0A1E5DZD0_9VIBR|nr:DUF58 domain-containing protein [Vibrio rumoiensis]OEF23288.1 cytosolic protein [Vibrio rumoiensis 1S-45]